MRNHTGERGARKDKRGYETAAESLSGVVSKTAQKYREEAGIPSQYPQKTAIAKRQNKPG